MPTKLSPVTSVRDFFSSELRTALSHQKVTTESVSFEYLVELLTRFLESSAFFSKDDQGKTRSHYLVDLYIKYIEGDTLEKKVSLKKLGDVSLFVAGFFPDSLNRKLNDIDYYLQMGEAAYFNLSSLEKNEMSQRMFIELSKKFKPLTDVLNEVSEKSGLLSHSDILRLYEKWLISGSSYLKEMLVKKGIIAINLDTTFKH